MFIIIQNVEKSINGNKDIHTMCFLDLEKAFDKIKMKYGWKDLEKKGIQQQIIEIIKPMYHRTYNNVRTQNNKFETKNGLEQSAMSS